MENAWIGGWENQYGSQLNIDKINSGCIEGSFRSAVDKSIPAAEITGFCTGNLIVVAARSREEGKKIASWTGILQDDHIETLWHVAMGGKGPWEAFLTGSDIFTRV
jgi:hypothetical protein